MTATIYDNDRNKRTAELTHAECVRLSATFAIAAIVSHELTASGMMNVYMNGRMTQYDPTSSSLL